MNKAYLMGLIYGDGSVYFRHKYKDYTLEIEQKSKNFLKLVSRSIEKLYKKKGKISFHSGLWRLRVYSKKVYQEFIDVKKDPLKIFSKLTKKERFNFISGLIDAEGNVSEKRIRISNSHKQLLSEIRNFLESEGIKCGRIYPNTPKRKVWTLSIYGKNVRKLKKKVCLFHPKKRLHLGL